MKYLQLIALLALTIISASCTSNSKKPDLSENFFRESSQSFPEMIIPENLGINVHRYNFSEHNLNQIDTLGVKWIRTDLFWDSVEKKKGTYDFSHYDYFVEKVLEKDIGILFILDYGNALYDPLGRVTTKRAREKFAHFALEAVRHFQGKKIIWEIWNEPDAIEFWKPAPDPGLYIRLLKETSNAIKRSFPDELVIAPALGKFDLEFLEKLCEFGLLDYIDGLSIHFYGEYYPEAAFEYLPKVRDLVKKSGHPGIPIMCSEWGYPAFDPGYEELVVDWVQYGITKELWNEEIEYSTMEKIQGAFLVRSFLLNCIHDIKISIWYNWKNDGVDLNNSDINYGLVDAHDREKPAYTMLEQMISRLRGMKFIQRYESQEEDWIVEFQGGSKTVIVYWTTAVPHTIEVSGVTYSITGYPNYSEVY